MKMKAARWHGKQDIRIEELEVPKPAADEVLIQVKRCGICGTDLHEYVHGAQTLWVDKPHPLTGHMGPLVMGHEFSGVIAEMGSEVDKSRWQEGERVCVMPLLHCGKCKYCRMGLEHMCEQFGAIGLQWPYGGFGEYCTVKEYNLVKIPDNVTYEQGACVEPLSVALYGIRRGNLQIGNQLLITGGGPTASLTLLGAKAAGASFIYMTEIQPGRRQRCEQWGASEVFDPTKVDVAEERIKEINPNAVVHTYKTFYAPQTADQFDFTQYDYIVDAIDTVTGKIELIEQAQRAGTPIISSMGAGNKMDASAFEVTDIYKTSVCPLARVMRRELKKRGIKKLKVVYSKEPPITPLDDMSISCRTHCICPPGTARKCTQRRQVPGSNAFAPAAVGLIVAGEVVKDLTAWERPL